MALLVDQVTVVEQLLAPDEIVQLGAEIDPVIDAAAQVDPFQLVPEVQDAVAVAEFNKVVLLYTPKVEFP